MDDPLKPELDLVAALRLTAPPPAAWIEAAAQIPSTIGDLDAIERLLDSAAFRERFRIDPERAITEAGLEPSAALLGAVRERVGGS
jgi:hypothetical protein